jgi:DNA-binding PadR family transcriptional regulator
MILRKGYLPLMHKITGVYQMRGFHGRRDGDGMFGRDEGRRAHRALHRMRAMMGGGFGGFGGHGRFGAGFGGFGPDGEGFGGGFGGPFGGGFGGRGGPGGPGGFGGGGRRGKRFDGEQLRLLVLGLLAQEPQHGYQLIRAFAEKSGGAYQPSPGVLYPLLTMLDEQELIVKAEGETGARRQFSLTEAGRAEVEANKDAIEAAFARLAALAEVASRTDGAPVRRAVHNLRAAIMERLGRETVDGQLGFEVAKIIDEATQRIERL